MCDWIEFRTFQTRESGCRPPVRRLYDLRPAAVSSRSGHTHTVDMKCAHVSPVMSPITYCTCKNIKKHTVKILSHCSGQIHLADIVLPAAQWSTLIPLPTGKRLCVWTSKNKGRPTIVHRSCHFQKPWHTGHNILLLLWNPPATHI